MLLVHRRRSLKFPPTGLSLQWYAELFDATRSRQIHRAALNSLEVAAWSTGLATLFGTMAALALARSEARWARTRHALHVADDPSRPRLAWRR